MSAHIPAPARRLRGDAGQSLPLVALLVVVAVGAAALVGVLGDLVADRARARTAADAAALAAAAEGPTAAADLARRNGGEVLGVDTGGAPDASEVTVEVRVGRAVASARARREPVRPPGRSSRRLGG